MTYSVERGGFLRETHLALFAAIGMAPRIVQEASQTHTVLAPVNRGIGLALVPSPAQALRMDNLANREIDVPDAFRSDLYLAVAPKRRSIILHARVHEVTLYVLAADP